jgi:hypothetical protein
MESELRRYGTSSYVCRLTTLPFYYLKSESNFAAFDLDVHKDVNYSAFREREHQPKLPPLFSGLSGESFINPFLYLEITPFPSQHGQI